MSSAPIRGTRIIVNRFRPSPGAAQAQGLIATLTLALMALAMGCGGVGAPRRGGSDARGLLLVDGGGSGPAPDQYLPPKLDQGLPLDGQAPPPDTQAVQPATVTLTITGMT